MREGKKSEGGGGAFKAPPDNTGLKRYIQIGKTSEGGVSGDQQRISL